MKGGKTPDSSNQSFVIALKIWHFGHSDLHQTLQTVSCKRICLQPWLNNDSNLDKRTNRLKLQYATFLTETVGVLSVLPFSPSDGQVLAPTLVTHLDGLSVFFYVILPEAEGCSIYLRHHLLFLFLLLTSAVVIVVVTSGDVATSLTFLATTCNLLTTPL